ncbi:DUF3943 domain-containing protein [Anaeromyxobacter sp. SG17]|uniref:DUF3943 domain-containing protein n=1 Tax=Anaeromyxobacter sp. SG17 TaxID=2925405 RepID=UPI001F56896B|nr:DUF3943 domain-containing protein [Anaeromyxobacter sp. SG17]
MLARVISPRGRASLLALAAVCGIALARPAGADAPTSPRERDAAQAEEGMDCGGAKPAAGAAQGEGGDDSPGAASAKPAASAGGARPAGAGESEDGAGSVASGVPDLTFRSPQRRGLLPRGHLLPALETGVITGVMLGWNVSIGGAPWARVTAHTIGRNLRGSWVLDEDRFWINQIGHPFQGIFPYSAARSSGLGFWASTPYPFVASAIWEIVGETTLPSVNDQITTPLAGVVLGEMFHRVSGMILDGPRSGWRLAAATTFAPIESMNRALVGTDPPAPTPRSRVQLRVGALSFDPDLRAGGNEGVVPELGVRLSYGLPGDPRFRFERPFDHFELESTYSTEKDPLATLFARGVLAGRTFEGERVRGLAGVALQFDFSALRRHSVSTSAVGLSAEGRWELAPRVALEGAATASAVLLGAAGYLGGRPVHDRSYRMGPGGQAHLEAQLRALDRIAARLVARQYLIAGLGSLPGLERVSTVTGALELRVVGPHALGVEGLLSHHAGDAGGGAPARSETGTELRAYYAFTAGVR